MVREIEVYEIAFLLFDYYDALRREKRFDEADSMRMFLVDCGFELKTNKDGITQFNFLNMEAYKKLEKKLLGE